MNKELIFLFCVYSGVLACALLLTNRFVKQSWLFLFTLFAALSFNPIFIALKGVQSTIYLQDFMTPIFGLIAYYRWKYLSANQKPLASLASILFIVLPICCLILVFLFDPSSHQFNSRNMMAFEIWIFRATGNVMMFITALSLNKGNDNLYGMVYLLFVGCAVLIIFGVLNYTGIFASSSYEKVLFADNDQASYTVIDTTLGWGFSGLHRASVGQVMSNILTILLGLLLYVKGSLRPVIVGLMVCGIASLLASYSRAGLIGTAAGFFYFGLTFSGKSRAAMPVIVVIAVLAIPFFAPDSIMDRISSISTYSDSSSRTRIDAWIDSISIFFSDLSTLLVGSGPTNRTRVFELIGAYGAHNEYIDSVFRLGIFGCITLIAFVFTLYRHNTAANIGSFNQKNKLFRTLLASLVVVNAVLAISQSALLADYSGYTAAYFVLFLYGLFALPVEKPNTTKSSDKVTESQTENAKLFHFVN